MPIPSLLSYLYSLTMAGGRKTINRDRHLHKMRRVGQNLPPRMIETNVSSNSSIPSSTTLPSRALLRQSSSVAKAGTSAEDSIVLSSGGSSDSSFAEPLQSSTKLKTPESDDDDSDDNDSDSKLIEYFANEKEERARDGFF